jgi:hypothetical protein
VELSFPKPRVNNGRFGTLPMHIFSASRWSRGEEVKYLGQRCQFPISLLFLISIQPTGQQGQI